MELPGMKCVGRMWQGSEIMGIGGFDLSAASRGVYAGLVHGIASHPKSKPKTPAAPATGAPPQPHPPNPWDAFAKALGANSPTLDMHYTVCWVCSSAHPGKHFSVDLAEPPPPSLERRNNVARTVA